MVETVYLGTLIPLAFLLVSVTEGNKRLIAFLMAGFTAALAAFYANNAIAGIFPSERIVLVTLIAPVTEEVLKLLPILALLFIRTSRSRYEIVRNALACGIGFSILENFYYVQQYAPAGMATAIGFIIVRSLSASLLHGVVSALSGYCIQQLQVYGHFSIFLIAGSLGTSILVHSLFNYIAFIPNTAILCVIVPLPLFLIEFFAWNFYGRKNSRIIEVQGGEHARN